MNAKTYLIDYIKHSSVFLEDYFDRKRLEIEKEAKEGKRTKKGRGVVLDMLSRYRKFCQGGKRLRGAQIQLGYELGGGKKKDILGPSTSIELIHGFLLMHDDIQDKDVLRRGFPTIHKQYEEWHKTCYSAADHFHYGLSMGINMGDLGAYFGTEVLLSGSQDEKLKTKVAIFFSKILQRVAFGQGLDISYEQQNKVTEKDVLEVHLQKTSIYTVGGPIAIGAILAGVSKRRIEAILKYGEPIGIAFQLRDDELGLFSSEEELGKPVGSDIREGKNTILKVKALEESSGKDREFLVKSYGNRGIRPAEVEKVKEITIKTGAFAYSKKLSRKLVKEGKKFIPLITKDSELQDTLVSFADFMVERNS